MSLFAQHGYGKADKITTLANWGNVAGVILSPADENEGALASTVAQAHDSGLEVLLDPQSYIYSIVDGSARCHQSHGLDFDSIHWSIDANTVAGHVDAVEAANRRVGISKLKIAPTCLQTAFGDVWTTLALQYARTAAASWGGKQTLVTVAVDEGGLGDWDVIEEWLDVATTLDVAGFYFLVARPRTYPPGPWNPTRLTNLLRLFYRLAVVNGYRVIWGYSDLDGALGISSGASAGASGWYYTLRNFSVAKWQPSEGPPRQPAPRVLLLKLWTPIRADPEAADIFRSTAGQSLFSTSLQQRFASGSFESWSRNEAVLHHLDRLGLLCKAVARIHNVPDRIEKILKSLRIAADKFNALSEEGVALPSSYVSRLRSWSTSLEELAVAENL